MKAFICFRTRPLLIEIDNKMKKRNIYEVGQIVGVCKYIEEIGMEDRYTVPKRMIKVECECGNVFVADAAKVKRGARCGCKKGGNIVHGYASGLKLKTEYISWQSMISRCSNSNGDKYKNYGGRGITVSKEWREFKNFIRDMGNKPDKSYSLDRIDVNGNYCKENCRWATQKTQMNNTSCNRVLEYNGKTKTTAQWASETGIGHSTIWVRLKLGWSVEDTLGKPVMIYKKRLIKN